MLSWNQCINCDSQLYLKCHYSDHEQVQCTCSSFLDRLIIKIVYETLRITGLTIGSQNCYLLVVGLLYKLLFKTCLLIYVFCSCWFTHSPLSLIMQLQFEFIAQRSFDAWSQCAIFHMFVCIYVLILYWLNVFVWRWLFFVLFLDEKYIFICFSIPFK